MHWKSYATSQPHAHMLPSFVSISSFKKLTHGTTTKSCFSLKNEQHISLPSSPSYQTTLIMIVLQNMILFFVRDDLSFSLQFNRTCKICTSIVIALEWRFVLYIRGVTWLILEMGFKACYMHVNTNYYKEREEGEDFCPPFFTHVKWGEK